MPTRSTRWPTRAHAAGRDGHTRVAVEVALLLRCGAGAERKGTLLPDLYQGYRVRMPVRPDRDDPVQLRAAWIVQSRRCVRGAAMPTMPTEL